MATITVASLLLGAQQLVSDTLARRASVYPSLVAHLPQIASDRWITVSAQRLLVARETLAARDRLGARREIDALPDSPDRAALAGSIAEASGDDRAAIAAYFAAGDFDGLERIAMHWHLSGNQSAALALQHTLVRQLQSDRTRFDALAEAWWQLGELSGPSPAALDAFERAHALAPFNQKYLLSAAAQALALVKLDRAETLFNASYDADPASAQALAGLGEVALQRGRHADAHAYLARAQRIDAALPDVEQLAQKLHE